jgi:hypothetical protein
MNTRYSLKQKFIKVKGSRCDIRVMSWLNLEATYLAFGGSEFSVSKCYLFNIDPLSVPVI